MIRTYAPRVRQRASQPIRLPPPIGGWNAKDALPAMKSTDAITLDNYVCGASKVDVRKGFRRHATGLGAPVETLMEYSNTAGTRTLFAATPTAIFNATAAGAVGAAVVSGLSNGRWQHTLFSNSSGTTLHCVNGVDAPRMFNGTTWSTPAWTGVTATELIGVVPHMERLWFIRTASLRVYYGAVSAISGALTELDIGPQCRKGGFVVSMASVSRDGGRGAEAFLVIVTSEGEVVVYNGQDPSSPTTWGRVGVYTIPEPVGRRCMLNAGGEVAIITSRGVVPLSAVMHAAPSAQRLAAITDKIEPAFMSAYENGKSLFGWQITELPRSGLVVVNVPLIERSIQHQYVMATSTGAWSRWTGLNGGCWTLFDDDLYFGDNNGNVCRYGFDDTDNNAAIVSDLQTAYTPLGSEMQKLVTMARPDLLSRPDYYPEFALLFDYDTAAPQYQTTTLAAGGGVRWDEGDWDTSDWAPERQPVRNWQATSGIGGAVSFAMRAATSDSMTFNGVTVMAEVGGPL